MVDIMKVPIIRLLGPKAHLYQQWVPLRLTRNDTRYRRRCAKCKKFIAAARKSAYCNCCQAWRMRERRSKVKLRATFRHCLTAYEVLIAAGL
jgi:uncharacterized paraquat-inducible protein A